MITKHCTSHTLINECTSAMKEQWFYLGGEKNLEDTECVHINNTNTENQAGWENSHLPVWYSYYFENKHKALHSTKFCYLSSLLRALTVSECFHTICHMQKCPNFRATSFQNLTEQHISTWFFSALQLARITQIHKLWGNAFNKLYR